MKLGRRAFLKSLALAAGAVATGGALRWLRPSSAAELPDLADAALSRAKALGCSYADVRIDRWVERDTETVTARCSVRVIHAGRWGVALSASLGKADVARAVMSARTHAALRTDLFALDASAPAAAPSQLHAQETHFATSEGRRFSTLRRFA